mmetsp:Transcript_114869/g.357824  ORF Transcript_114869/g.357824 Transcript_114869/m.357824 type:complete len:309 (-) Transcript_114869:820-1746(-)
MTQSRVSPVSRSKATCSTEALSSWYGPSPTGAYSFLAFGTTSSVGSCSISAKTASSSLVQWPKRISLEFRERGSRKTSKSSCELSGSFHSPSMRTLRSGKLNRWSQSGSAFENVRMVVPIAGTCCCPSITQQCTYGSAELPLGRPSAQTTYTRNAKLTDSPFSACCMCAKKAVFEMPALAGSWSGSTQASSATAGMGSSGAISSMTCPGSGPLAFEIAWTISRSPTAAGPSTAARPSVRLPGSSSPWPHVRFAHNRTEPSAPPVTRRPSAQAAMLSSWPVCPKSTDLTCEVTGSKIRTSGLFFSAKAM